MQVNVKYRSWSRQDSQKLQNNASSHYPSTIFALCIYFLQYETPLFRIHVFTTKRLIHTPNLSWLQNLNFKLGALTREKRRSWPFIPEPRDASSFHALFLRRKQSEPAIFFSGQYQRPHEVARSRGS